MRLLEMCDHLKKTVDEIQGMTEAEYYLHSIYIESKNGNEQSKN